MVKYQNIILKMKLPKILNTYCPHCGKHGGHDVSLGKKGKQSSMREGQRKFEQVKKGYKGSPRTPKKQVYKIGKRTVAVLKCKSCGKKHQKVYRSRSRKRTEIE